MAIDITIVKWGASKFTYQMPSSFGGSKLVDELGVLYIDNTTHAGIKELTGFLNTTGNEYFTFNEKLGITFYGNKGTRLHWDPAPPPAGYWGSVNVAGGREYTQTFDVTSIIEPYGIPGKYGFTAYNSNTGEHWEFDGNAWIVVHDDTVDPASLGEVEQGVIADKFVSPKTLLQNSNILYRDGTRSMSSAYSPGTNQAISTKKYVDDKQYLKTQPDQSISQDLVVKAHSGQPTPPKVDLRADDMKLQFLPTIDPGVVGQLWNDAGTIKISI